MDGKPKTAAGSKNNSKAEKLGQPTDAKKPDETEAGQKEDKTKDPANAEGSQPVAALCNECEAKKTLIIEYQECVYFLVKKYCDGDPNTALGGYFPQIRATLTERLHKDQHLPMGPFDECWELNNNSQSIHNQDIPRNGVLLYEKLEIPSIKERDWVNAILPSTNYQDKAFVAINNSTGFLGHHHGLLMTEKSPGVPIRAVRKLGNLEAICPADCNPVLIYKGDYLVYTTNNKFRDQWTSGYCTEANFDRNVLIWNEAVFFVSEQHKYIIKVDMVGQEYEESVIDTRGAPVQEIEVFQGKLYALLAFGSILDIPNKTTKLIEGAYHWCNIIAVARGRLVVSGWSPPQETNTLFLFDHELAVLSTLSIKNPDSNYPILKIRPVFYKGKNFLICSKSKKAVELVSIGISAMIHLYTLCVGEGIADVFILCVGITNGEILLGKIGGIGKISIALSSE